MRNLALMVTFSLILILPVISNGQSAGTEVDTVTIFKPSKSEERFQINKIPLFSEVTFHKRRPRPHDFPGGRPDRRNENDFSLSSEDGGAQLGITKAKTFLLQGDIQYGKDSSWKVYLYVEGLKQVIRTKEESTDGGLSWSKEKSYKLLWDRIPIGMIGKEEDTITRFYISMSPESDVNFDHYIKTIMDNESLRRNFSDNENYWLTHTPFKYNYGLCGKHRDKELIILFNDILAESYIFIDSVWLCTFKSDLDFVEGIRKKDRIQPVIMIDNQVGDFVKNELIRLAFLSRFLRSVVSKSEYGVVI